MHPEFPRIISDDPWLRATEVASYARLSLDYVRRVLRSGQIESVGTGRLRRCRRSWVDAFLAKGARNA